MPLKVRLQNEGSQNRGRAGVVRSSEVRSSLVWLYVLGGKGECEMFVKKGVQEVE
jgi:hypothetical protein